MVTAAAIADIGLVLSWQEDRPLAPTLTGDGALARSAARGDRGAFARLVDLHKRAVHGLCARILRDPEEARDAAQEAFVRAYTAIDRYDPLQPFSPWLLRIARNHCLDVLRRRLPDSRTVALDAEAEDAGRREVADPAAPRGDEVIERRETAAALARAVDALPRNYREVVHLFHVEHLSYKEIAETLDVPIGTVMTWLHRARGRLRAALAGDAQEATP
ncbi:MAG TPA: sigma-70 family RNA polymerase sigma factor [Anaeromyxobacteraceae bacterium]|nr:sigma-70 family RNA polymerase sigma factor [Anaeromyxobacteraceae bacterium]